MDLNLRVFAYHSQPVLVLRQVDFDYTLLRPDGSVTLGMQPFGQLPAASYQPVAELLKQGLFLPNEVHGYQLQSAHLLEQIAASFQGDDMENILRVRLLPLMLMLDSVKRVLLPQYEQAIAQVLSAYYKELNPSQDRLLACWEDMSAAFNHVLSRQKEECMKRVVKGAMERGLIQHLMNVMQWMEVKELVKVDLDLLKAEVGPAEHICGRLMERYSDCEGVFDLLRMAHAFATEQQEQAVVSTSLSILRSNMREKLTKPQQLLFNSLLWHSTTLLLREDLSVKLLLADAATKAATQHLVIRQISTGIRSFESYEKELGLNPLLECFSDKGLKEVIGAKQWGAVKCLRGKLNLDQRLETNLSLLLEMNAPRNLLVFVTLTNSIKQIKEAKVPLVWKGHALETCMESKQWSENDKQRVAADVKVIRKLTCVFCVLFVKARTKLVRLPHLLAKEVILEYLVR